MILRALQDRSNLLDGQDVIFDMTDGSRHRVFTRQNSISIGPRAQKIIALDTYSVLLIEELKASIYKTVSGSENRDRRQDFLTSARSRLHGTLGALQAEFYHQKFSTGL